MLRICSFCENRVIEVADLGNYGCALRVRNDSLVGARCIHDIVLKDRLFPLAPQIVVPEKFKAVVEDLEAINKSLSEQNEMLRRHNKKLHKDLFSAVSIY